MTDTASRPAVPAGSVHGRYDALLDRLRAPVDGASLAVFRIAFGLVAVWEVYRYFANGWITRYWVDPQFHFTYHGFGWVQPMSGQLMHVLWIGLGLAAVGITLGLYYRACCVFFAVGFSYSFLLEAARYLNHFYLIALLAVLLAIVPAHRVWSMDAGARPPPRTQVVPTWALWLLRFQLGVVYFFGGLAKFEPDWLRGEPMRTWLGNESGLPVIGPLLTQEWVVLGASWGGLLFDLLIVFAVLWRRTRIPALIAAAGFNLINDTLFEIGVFPYLAFAGLLLFCDPGWPRAAWSRLHGRPWQAPDVVVPDTVARHSRPASGWRRALVPLAFGTAAVFVVAQLLVPLRYVLYPGKASWSEQGQNFAWHMKLRAKSGDADFTAVDPATGERFEIDPLDTLQPWQYEKMAIRPEMLREFAQHIRGQFGEQGRPGVQVYVTATARLNGRDGQLLVDPTVDLAAQPRSLLPRPWILPLSTELPAP